MLRITIACLFLCHLLVTPSIYAEQSTYSPDSIARNAAQLIEEKYILASKAKQIAASLREYANQGKYTPFKNTPQKMADILMKDIRDLSDDDHMYVEWVDADKAEDDWIKAWIAKGPSVNYGIKDVKILDGNIGYLAISSFYPLESAALAYKNAIVKLAKTQSLILDLRHNGGGSETSANTLIATFLPSHSQSPLLLETRQKSEAMAIPDTLDWPRYSADKELIILINNRTFSAPESIAFSLQEIGRATIIGQSSAGGAHMTSEPDDLGHGFKTGIPNARPLGRLSGKNWETIGVTPSIISSDEKAIEIALKTLNESSSPLQ